MISAFGVDHGEDVSKLFNNHPKMTGRAYTIYEVNGNKTVVHRPNSMIVTRAGKTLLLRRPKYTFEAAPTKVGAHKGATYYAQRSPLVRPNKDARRKINQLAQSKKGTVRGTINGAPTRILDKK